MSTLTTSSLNHLILEILLVILYYIDIEDILQVRRVSRYLNEATHNRSVWADAYRIAMFPRPPGPFLWQSGHDLETILTTSYRISRNLQRQCSRATQREAQTFKLREIRNVGKFLDVGLVFGRFLLVAFEEEIRCYDLNVDRSGIISASVIHKTTGQIMKSFHCVSSFNAEGRRFACAVLNETTEMATRISIYLLNEGKQSELTMDLIYQSPEYGTFDMRSVDLGPRAIAIGGRLGLSDSEHEWLLIVVDVHARTELLLPRLECKGQHWIPKCISTSTHLILARSFHTEATGWSASFQAFPLPTSHGHYCSTPASIPLPTSHHAIIPGINVRRVDGTLLLHDAVLDWFTQDVLISIRVCIQGYMHERSHLHHGILRLSTTRSQEAGTITFQSLGYFGHSRRPLDQPSLNGTGRVFYFSFMSTRILSALDYNTYAHGDGNDHEHRVKVLLYPVVLQFPTPCTLLDYDPYSGRICCRRTMGDEWMIEIFDFSM